LIEIFNGAFRKVFEDLVEPQLPAQHTEDKLMAERAICRLQVRFFCSQKN